MIKWVKLFKTEKTLEIQQARLTEACGKVKVMAKSQLKPYCYCPMVLMRTTKTVVCLQTKTICHHLYEFKVVF